jgi:hypothetical protein
MKNYMILCNSIMYKVLHFIVCITICMTFCNNLRHNHMHRSLVIISYITSSMIVYISILHNNLN